MNERIQKITGQVLDELVPETWVALGYDKIKEIQYRTAELIVKECIVHGKLTQSQTVVNGSEEYNAGRVMGIEVFINQIRKHFGVEE